MKLRVPTIDIQSLMIVLFAFVGNAQIQGVDLVLTAVAPAILILLLIESKSWRLSYRNLFFYICFSATLCIAAVQTFYVSVPYFDGYYLWPFKAFFLMTVLTFSRDPRWTTSNLTAFALLALGLIGTGHFEEGRLFSAFGPNMLYRIFGMLALFALMQRFQPAGGNKLVVWPIFALGMVGLILTGSSGAIVVSVVIVMFYLYTRSKRLFFGIIGGVSLIIWQIWQNNLGLFDFYGSNFSIVSRALYKSADITANDRLNGFAELFSKPFALFGHSHSDFSTLWSTGYQYPHNIFAELYAFYGISGVVLIAAITLTLYKLATIREVADVYSMTFVVLLVGTSLSGDLSDNYGLVGLATGLLLRATRTKWTPRIGAV